MNRRLLTGITMLVALSITGCGSGSDSSDDNKDSATTAAASSEGSDTTAAAEDSTASSGDAGSAASGDVVQVADGGAVKVGLVPGGAHPYFQPWKQGGDDAVADFGLGGVTFNETGEWDQAKQNGVLDTLGAQGYQAFGIFGVSPTDINSTFQDLEGKGFVVASLASCPAGDTNDASFCLSTDVKVAAKLAAEAAIEAMGGEGNLVHLTGNNVDSNTQRRMEGVQEAVDATGGKVTLLQTVTDIDVDLATADRAVADLLAAQGNEINGIVTTAFNPAVAAAAGVTDAGLPIKVVAIDDDPSILQGIKDGSVSATIAQNPYGQAYVGTWALALLQTKQCTMTEDGVIVDSGSFIVTQDNVDTYDDERMAKTQSLLSDFSSNYLTCS